MRPILWGALCALICTSGTSPAQTAEAQTGAYVYEACQALAVFRPSSLENPNPSAVGFCIGYVRAAHSALIRVHNFYQSLPGYGDPKNEAFLTRWIALQITLGADVCLPNGLNPVDLARAIERFGRENPDQLNADAYMFTALALQTTYPCLDRYISPPGRPGTTRR